MKQTCGRLWAALLIAVVGLVGTQAEAGIVSATASGDATIGATPDASPVDFVGFGGFYPGSAFLNSVTGTTGAILSFTTDGNYDYNTLPYPHSDRLVLDVTNNSSVALTSITFGMGYGVSILDFGSYEIYPGVYSSPAIYTGPSDGVAAAPSGATYYFASPLAIGASEGFYIPIVIPTTPTTFTITESVNSTPEPGSLMLLGSGLAGLGALGWMKRRRAQTTAV
jgi:PEP-CTERM motif